VNIGYPINTPEDDIYFYLSPDGKRAYFSSVRPDGNGDQDIYVAHMPAAVEAVTLVKGKVTSACDGQVLDDAVIEIIDNRTDKITARSKPNSVTGNYLIILDKGKNYTLQVSAGGHQKIEEIIRTPKKEDYQEMKKDLSLNCEGGQPATSAEPVSFSPATTPTAAVKFSNVYFEVDATGLSRPATKELDSLFRFLKKYPQMTLLIEGHTDPTGDANYNQLLSIRRAEMAKGYLMRKGLPEERILVKGHGDSRPLMPHLPDGHPDRKYDRRIEFTIIKE
jgi:outer membrane protein OmpA-like peptidoglycan-associated protein